MSKAAKLENQPRTTGMDDYRAWGQKAEELLLEIYELCKANKIDSIAINQKIAGRISQFLDDGSLPTLQ